MKYNQQNFHHAKRLTSWSFSNIDLKGLPLSLSLLLFVS
jgi:hypothetical protein